MNPWDVFTWFMVILQAGAALVIFVLFLRDLGGVLRGGTGPDDERG